MFGMISWLEIIRFLYRVIINDLVGHFVIKSYCVIVLECSIIFSWIQLSTNCGVSFTCLCIFISHFWCLFYVFGVLLNWFILWGFFVIMVGYQCLWCCHLLFSTASIFLIYSMVSSCDIIGTLGVINLVGATFAGTLSVGTVIGTLICAIVGISLGKTLDYYFLVSWC